MNRAAERATAPALITDIASLRADFPALQQLVHGKPLAYLDNAASSQQPRAALDAEALQQRLNHANVHRGVHELSERATAAFEGARAKVRSFINAAGVEEIVFTRGTTESINLVAASLGRQILRAGDEVLITWLEHHSNIVPWQLICEQTGARLVVAPITDSGELDRGAFRRALSARTKIVALAHVSNALGTVNPVAELTAEAHAAGAVVLVDAAQAVPHMRVDVRALDCDFLAFSGHKMFGPTGIGVLYGKRALLESLPPYQGGGDMILTVAFDRTTYNALPYKFEAGTPNITGAVGLGAAVDYLERIDFAALAAHEDALLEHATERLLAEIPGARLIGTARDKASVLSFVIDGIHPHDLGTIVDREGVAIRTGHHCAMPVMERFGVAATARASFALYNDRSDVDRLLAGLKRAVELFRG
ncbi:MAG TPA: cysteine desulfurase [Gammaproteobacteria bacterium]|nr:cysteine desulfurase [Gammaproteobacteria bacterium]